MNISFNRAPHSIWTHPIHFIACGFGIGAIPFMPGTFGTAAALPLYFLCYTLPWWLYALIGIGLCAVGVWLCDITNRDFGTEDHSAAVWDEIAAFFLTLTAIPPKWYYLLAAFLLFRILDIWKPGPIGWLDKNVHGGLGVMLDDIAAGLVTWIIVKSASIFLPTIL